MTNNQNRQKGISPSSSKLGLTVRPCKSPNTISIPKYTESDSIGANPIIHECSMHRRKPMGMRDAEIQLKKMGVKVK